MGVLDKTSIAFFGRLALPNECVRSILVRYCIRTATDMKTIFSAITERQKIRLHPALPSFLKGISEALDLNVEDLLLHNTLFPLYAHFMSSDRQDYLRKSMYYDQPLEVAKAVRWASNQIKIPPTIKACPRCANEDIKIHGVSYWHIEHQIPALKSCCRHQCNLLESPLSTSGWDQLQQLPVGGNGITSRKEDLPLALCAAYMMSYLSKNTSQINPYEAYTDVALRQGLITKSGSIKVKRIREKFSDLLRDPSGDALDSFHLPRLRNFCDLLRKDRWNKQHLLTHLLFMARVVNKPTHLVADCPSPSFGAEAKQIKTNRATNDFSYIMMLKRGMSVNQLSKKSGRSRTYLKRLALRNAIPIQLRPRVISHQKRRLIALKAQNNKSNSQIVCELSLTKSGVEMVVGQFPETQKYRRLLVKRTLLLQRRKAIESIVTTSTTLARRDVVRAEYCAYHWLYRNDKIWLEKMLPPARAKIRPMRVDWEKRDRQLVGRVEELIAHNWRCKSWEALDREFGSHGWFVKYRNKLPLSAKLASTIAN